MLRSNSKSLGNYVVSPEEEKERLQREGFAEKEGFKSGMKERVIRERRCVLLSHYFGHLSLLCVRGFDRSSSRSRSTCRIASCRATCDSASPTTTSTATTARCSTNKTFSTSSTNASRR